MNRNIEWERLVSEVKSSLPTRIEQSAERAVYRMKIAKYIVLFIKAPAAVFFVFFAVFAALENTSQKFAKTTQKIPCLGYIAKLVTLNPNMRSL